jgi:hypothetical protein
VLIFDLYTAIQISAIKYVFNKKNKKLGAELLNLLGLFLLEIVIN